MSKILKIGFGGGCHWCTEAVFQSLEGVKKVEQGWIASKAPYDTFSEAVIVHYSPKDISLEKLIFVHLNTHSSMNAHQMRGKYRSAIYYFNEPSISEIQEVMEKRSQISGKKYVTKTLAFKEFKLNQEDYLNYFKRQPDKPFCQRYIVPKLDWIAQIKEP